MFLLPRRPRPQASRQAWLVRRGLQAAECQAGAATVATASGGTGTGGKHQLCHQPSPLAVVVCSSANYCTLFAAVLFSRCIYAQHLQQHWNIASRTCWHCFSPATTPPRLKLPWPFVQSCTTNVTQADTCSPCRLALHTWQCWHESQSQTLWEVGAGAGTSGLHATSCMQCWLAGQQRGPKETSYANSGLTLVVTALLIRQEASLCAECHQQHSGKVN